jgi:hypothetical protein
VTALLNRSTGSTSFGIKNPVKLVVRPQVGELLFQQFDFVLNPLMHGLPPFVFGCAAIPMTGFEVDDFVLRERALAAFRVLENDRQIGREIPQLPDFPDGDRGFVPWVFLTFDVQEELLASF